ncbi:MAG: hypothetical protein IKL44_07420 [Clostridia bacterium]|nr:hypothetical protein [Clostridia bacterium]
MKKYVALILSALVIFTMAGCGKKKEKEYKLGLGIISEISSEDTEAIVKGTIATVVLDSDGKIIECRLDAVENKIDVEGGKPDSEDIASDFETKQELGEDYGMKEASKINKEWYEQADHFSNYVEGLTAEQVGAIGTDKETETDQLILSGCTIDISDFVKAIVLACEDKNYQRFNAAEFKLGLAVKSAVEKNDIKEAADKDGLIPMECTVSAVVTDKEGKSLAANLDVFSANIKYNKEGKVTNSGEKLQTKKQLGDEYGMKAASKINMEWYEQARAFEQYVAGLDATGVNSIMLTTDNKAEDTILKAGCTIAIDNFMHSLYKAINYAK